MYHKHGGNGWGIVELLSENYCRVVSLGKGQLGNQAFLAYGGSMERNGELDSDLINKLTTLRKEIESGKKKVVSTRFQDVA